MLMMNNYQREPFPTIELRNQTTPNALMFIL